MGKKVIAIIGTYRKGHIIDTAVTEVLSGAKSKGAQTTKIYLLDKHIEFCKNCRSCTQQAGNLRGECIQNDDMQQLLTEIDNVDGIVLGAPVNFFNVTAIMKKFIERLLPYVYWAWGKTLPENRIKKKSKKAVIITSSGCPEWLGRIFFAAAIRVLKAAANCMGAKVVKKIYVGGAAMEKDQPLPKKYKTKSYKAGRLLVS